MKTLLAFTGSTRAASFHTRIIRVLPSMAPDNARVALFDLSEVPFYNQDLEGDNQPAAVLAMRAAVAEADGIIFAAPEYNGSYSALTKNTIDWLTRPMGVGALRGKKIMVISVTPGPGGGRKITSILSELLPLFGNEVVATVNAAAIHEKIDANDSITDGELAASLRDGLRSLS
ncbi:MAG: NADPH-dependent FMN reductase [Ilumatobacteraceae bacterium]|jgi:chromate reductase